MSEEKKRRVYGSLLSLGIIGINVYLWGLRLPLDVLQKLWLLQGIIGGIVYLYMHSRQKEMQKLMEDLSQLIGQLISGEGKEVFSPLKDEMPSKLQVEVARLSEILRRQMEDMQQEKEGIESLVGDIAHQLKTPLTNVGMYTELLEDDGLDEESYQMFYGGLRREVSKLTFLVETLIKMSRLEGGVIKLNRQQSNLQDTCLRAIKTMHMKAKAKHIDISYKGDAELVAYYDVKWTSEAIENIIDNAIKYSPASTTIHVCMVPYEMFVRIDIEDEGRGKIGRAHV